MWQLSRQNISRRTIGRHFFGKLDFQFEKKTVPGQIRTHDLCCPLRIRYPPANCTEDTTKFEIFINQDTKKSVKQVVNPKKSIF